MEKNFEYKVEGSKIGDEVVVIDNSNYNGEYAEDCPFKAVIKSITDYPCIWVDSVVTGKEYELYPQQLEVAYLTKEQIEAEGWNSLGTYSDGTGLFNIGNNHNGYESVYKDEKLKITKLWSSHGDTFHRKDLYLGECKDVNCLRFISKLVGIKKEE